MASCCVSREVWIHSLLAVPVVLHAVRASRSWRPRVARVLEARPHGQHLRACERAPLHPLQSAIRTDAPLHRCTAAPLGRASRQVYDYVYDYEATWRCGTPATMGHRHAPP